jgi:hypothetical protein
MPKIFDGSYTPGLHVYADCSPGRNKNTKKNCTKYGYDTDLCVAAMKCKCEYTSHTTGHWF